MSNHDKAKYGFSADRPIAHTANRNDEGQCAACPEPIVSGDKVAYFDEDLMHFLCAMDEWELDQ